MTIKKLFLLFYVVFEQIYNLVVDHQPDRSRENLAFEMSMCRGGRKRLIATTLQVSYTDPKQVFSVLVSYEAKVRKT